MFIKTSRQVEASLLLTNPDITNILLLGGAGSGKTILFLRGIIIRALKTESRHIIFRQIFAHIKASLWYNSVPKTFQLCFPDLKRNIHYQENKSDWFIKFINGSEIWFAGLDDKERTEKILGNEYSTLYFNECSQISYSSILMAMTRLRQKNDLILKAYYDCNPPTKTHWTYKLFIKGEDPDTKTKLLNKKDYASIQINPVHNEQNLPEKYIEILKNLPARQKKRFWDGEFTDDIAGALWTLEMIVQSYTNKTVDELLGLTVVSIDPAITNKKNSNETGIIITTKKENDYAVLEDASEKYSPDGWANVALTLFDKYEANCIVAEVNQGGDMVEAIIKNKRKDVPVRQVRATKGKYMRAEPIATLYEQGLVKHIKQFEILEDQMQSYTIESDESPDRLDALVWGLTYLSKPQPILNIIRL